MPETRTYALAIAGLLAPVVPVGGVFLYHAISGNPVYQPLGISREKLAQFNPDEENATVQIRVEWGREVPASLARGDFLQQVDRAIAVRTSNYTVDIMDVPGPAIHFTFAVAGNVLGPYPPGQVARGIQDAIAIQTMYRYGTDP